MGDILKEAIADAKAVRETALENAKMALEEAFTPQIKSMLSAKLKEEEDETEEGEHEPAEEQDEVPAEEGEHETEEGEHDAEEGRHEEGDDEAEEGRMTAGEEPAEEGEHETEEGEHEENEEPAEEGEHETEEGEHDAEEGEDKLDLESIIRELESELEDDEDEDDDNGDEDDDDDDDDDNGDDSVEEEYEIHLEGEDEKEEDDELEEVDKSSGIGKSDNKVDDTDKSSDVGKGDNKLSEIKAELKEYKEAVSFLKDKLHEVNILNAKLLFTNKLFKQYSLDDNQKLKVVETFDRAQTTREIKLVYSTLAEQFGDNGSIARKKSISESASAAVSSTKPSKESRKVISEETQVANRFRKLAGLL